MSVEQHEVKPEEGKELEPQGPSIDVEALVAKVEQLEQTNNRILDESKTYKEKYRQLRDGVQKEKAVKLEEGENWKELLDIEKNKTHGLEESLNKYKKTSIKKDLQFQVAKHANNAFDVEDVIRSLPQDLISIDDENLTVQGVDEAVARVKEHKPYLFNSTTKHGMVNSRPESKPKDKTLDERINENPNEMLKEALGQMLSQ